MNKIFEHSLLLLGCGYYLLIAYGIVKLPPLRQQKFDELMRKRRVLLLALAYVIIVLLIFLIARDLS